MMTHRTARMGWSLLIFLLALGLLFIPENNKNIYAQGSTSRVVDDAGLLTSAQAASLEEKAEQISEAYDTDVFFITSTESASGNNYARSLIEIYGETNYPNGYVGYMINMADRSYWIDAYGSTNTEIFNASVIDKLTDKAYDYLSSGDYYGSANAVLSEIGNQLELAQPMGWLKKPFLYPVTSLLMIGITGVVAAVFALIMTAAKVSHHKDKGISLNAAKYGSGFALTANQDLYVSTYQTRVPRPKQNTGGGGGHGGGGGGFGGGGGGHSGGGGHF